MRVVGQGPRWEILQLLAETPMTVTDISAALYLSMSATSRHLRSLEVSCLVCAARSGNSKIYRLTDRIRIARKGDAFQFAMATENGQLVLFQTDKDGHLAQTKPALPDIFIDAEVLAIVHDVLDARQQESRPNPTDAQTDTEQMIAGHR
jgi:DNA-binding transcriptional ArsR family regulator